MPIANNIGQNLRMFSVTILWTLGSPYKMLGCVPIGQILLNLSSDVFLLLPKVFLNNPLISFPDYPYSLATYYFQY